MKKIALMVIAFYPLLFVIDLIQNTNYMQSYHAFVMDWWLLGLVVLASYWLIKSDTMYRYNELEGMRVRQYFAEVRRWENTPYVPPITLLYLKNPPGPFSPYDRDYVNNTFYRLVVNDFRDKVYILMDFDEFEPTARHSYLSVIGSKNLARLALYLAAPFSWLYFSFFLKASYGGWEMLLLPIVVRSLYRAALIINAILFHLPSNLDSRLEFESANRKVTWREAFPDTPVGETFLRAYYVEMERRSRFEAQLQNRVVPLDMAVWNNPNYPPYPYPASSIPAWESEYDGVFEEKMAQVVGNNVIQLRHSK